MLLLLMLNIKYFLEGSVKNRGSRPVGGKPSPMELPQHIKSDHLWTITLQLRNF